MRKLYYLMALILAIPFMVSAQSNYKAGYVVGLKGDTVKGFIDYREWSFNPTRISFKQSLADKQSRQLTAGDISYFELTGLEAYKRYEGPITMDDPNHTNESRDTSVKKGVFLLKILQQGGRVTLYSYTDDVKTRFFIREEGGQPVELIYRSYLAVDETSPDKRKQVTENTYFRQLSLAADKYHLLDGAMKSEIRHADYYKQNLLKIISRINGISKADYENQYNERSNVSFSASAAVNFSAINPYGNYKSIGGKSSSSIFPAISVGAGIYSNPNTQRLEFIVQGILSGNQYQSIYIYTGSPYVPVKYSFHQLWLAVAPQAQYNFFNTPDLKIFAGVGLALTYHNYYNAKYDVNYAGTQVTNGNLSDFRFFNNFTFPVMIKAGARIGSKVELFGTYFANSAVTNDHYFTLNYNSLQFGLNYILK